MRTDIIYEHFLIWICHECGTRYGNREVGVATWHTGECDICHRVISVTEPRDFGGIDYEKLKGGDAYSTEEG